MHVFGGGGGLVVVGIPSVERGIGLGLIIGVCVVCVVCVDLLVPTVSLSPELPLNYICYC